MADKMDAQDFLRAAVGAPFDVVATFRAKDGTVEQHFALADGTRECEITRPGCPTERSPLPHGEKR